MCRLFNWFGTTEAPTEGLSALEKAKKVKKTRNNHHINRIVWETFVTKDKMQYVRNQFTNSAAKVIFSEQYSEFSQILPNLYLTGLGGLTAENLEKHNITAVVNVSFEAPAIDVSGVEFIRIPIEDDPKEILSVYLDEVADQINDWTSHQRRVVIHCLCGVSRSVSFTLAYLMKHKRESLKTAFMRVYKIRTFIKPNYSFMAQLIEFDQKLFKKSSVKMVLFEKFNGRMISTPDLYIEVFPEKFVKSNGTYQTPDAMFGETTMSTLETIF